MTEKTIIALATNIPMRINDFNELKKNDILPLFNSTEYPVYFMFKTKKTKTPMPCFITKETMNLLRKYLNLLKQIEDKRKEKDNEEDNEKGNEKENPYLFQGQGIKKLNEDSINRILKNLVKKAGIDTRGQNVRFHLFRKVFIGVARSMIGLSDDQVKMLTGKRVKGDMSPYYVS